MTWVRNDDQSSIHRKVRPLSDAAYRLNQEAKEWCSRNLTDGRIAADEFPGSSCRATPKYASELVRRGLWHRAGGEHCGHERCSPPGADGYSIHDYLDYNPSAVQVAKERAAKAERQRNWIAKKRGRDGSRDASQDASTNGPRDGPRDESLTLAPSPPRPAPKEAGAGHPQHQPAAMGGAAGGPGEPNQNHRASPPCHECGNATTSAYHRNVCRGAA